MVELLFVKKKFIREKLASLAIIHVRFQEIIVKEKKKIIYITFLLFSSLLPFLTPVICALM